MQYLSLKSLKKTSGFENKLVSQLKLQIIFPFQLGNFRKSEVI